MLRYVRYTYRAKCRDVVKVTHLGILNNLYDFISACECRKCVLECHVSVCLSRCSPREHLNLFNGFYAHFRHFAIYKS
jgi:hypothetical protein